MKTVSRLPLLALLFLLLSCSQNEPAQKRIAKTMLIHSLGEITLQPDMASLTINLECTNRNIKVSRDCLVQKSEELNTVLLGYGIQKEDLVTTALNLSKSYRWQNNSNVFMGYRSSVSTQVTIRDLKVLEELYPELLVNKNLNLGGLSYSHSKMDSLSLIAYQSALDKANSIADNLLQKMEASDKEIMRIGNSSLPERQQAYEYDGYMDEVANEFAESKAKITVNNGMMYISKDLVVEYIFK